MKRVFFLVAALFYFVHTGISQEIGQWEPHLSYYNTTAVAEANNHVYAIASNSLYSYNKEDNSIRFYSKENGLSDNKIIRIGFNPATNILLIAYENSNLDLLGEEGIYNLPYLYNSSIPSKTINQIRFYDEYAYLSTSFGIMVVNLKKKEITDTYQLKTEVYDVCIHDNYVYAATPKGFIRGKKESNLLDTNNWETYPLHSDEVDEKAIRKIEIFQGMLFFFVENQGVYYQQADKTIRPLFVNSGSVKIRNMTLQNGKLIPYSATTAYIYSSLTSREQIDAGTIHDISSLKKENTFWIAGGTQSIIGIQKETSGNPEIIFSDPTIATTGPKRNLAAFMTMRNRKLVVAGGGRWEQRSNNPFTVLVYEDEKWESADDEKIMNTLHYYMQDATCVAIDPADNNHYFVSSWGEGLFEFQNNVFTNLYNFKNSPLEYTYGTTESVQRNYVRVEGVCYDKEGNLWMTNSGVENGIKIRKADSSWVSLYYAPLRNQVLLDKILITSKGHKWINIPRSASSPGIFVLNDQGTIENTDDDVYYFHSAFYDSNGKIIPANAYLCMAEDKNKEIWIGTNNGLIVCPVPEYAPANTEKKFYCNRIVRTDEYGTLGYLLDGIQVNCLAVDGANRKWVGTEGSGVFLLNEDGSETLENFTTTNSPLLSNYVKSIAVDPVNGKVFFGTDQGIISYVGEATEGSESYSDVYAFPNPVRPEYNGRVTITGLMANSNVKITDVNGNLIYQGKSAGGQLTWDCRNRAGKRVAIGIYLVLSATPDSKESVVTKIMIVK